MSHNPKDVNIEPNSGISSLLQASIEGLVNTAQASFSWASSPDGPSLLYLLSALPCTSLSPWGLSPCTSSHVPLGGDL